MSPFKDHPTNPNLYPSRYSFAYFCNANFDMNLSTLPNCSSPKNPSKYEEINSF